MPEMNRGGGRPGHGGSVVVRARRTLPDPGPPGKQRPGVKKPFFQRPLRGAGGDELVGVTSIFGSGARAHVKFFIIFFSAWYAPYHQKKKEIWANSGARADPKVLPSQGRFSVGAQARVSRLLGFLDKNGSPARRPPPRDATILCTLVSKPTTRRAVIRPWGQRASQIRVRARAFFLNFIFSFEWYAQKSIPCRTKKKWPPASRVRARTPTHSSPPPPLKVGTP